MTYRAPVADSEADQSVVVFTSRTMKLWKKSLVLIIALLIYLFLGAVVFRLLESYSNELAQQNFLDAIEDFLDNHTCVSQDELRDLFVAVEKSLSGGAFKIDNDPNNDDNMVVWDFPGAVFFTTTVVTTIGYGNLAPKTSLGRVVCMFYALIGIPLTYWLLSAVGDTFQGCWRPCHGFIRRCTKNIKNSGLRTTLEVAIIGTVLYVILVALPALLFSYLEDWDFFQSQYFCFISLSTIGFGDFVPAEQTDLTQLSRWLYKLGTVAYLIIGLSILSVAFKGFLNSQQSTLNKWKAKKAAKKLMQLQKQQRQQQQQQQHASPSATTDTSNGVVNTSVRFDNSFSDT